MTPNPQPRLGVLGGGQLAQMLCQAAPWLGVTLHALVETERSPAAQTGMRFTVGSPNDPKALLSYFTEIDLCIFENEFLDTDLLQKAAGNAEFVPNLKTLRLFQDKLAQKKALTELEIPTTRFQPLTVDVSLQDIEKDFPQGFVLKWSRMGYDGKGVLICRPGKADPIKLTEFVKAGLEKGAQIYAEDFVPFKRELSIVAVLSKSGEFAVYPVVVSEQRDGICWRVKGPASAFGLSVGQEKEIQDAAEKLGRAKNLYGVFALEIFETASGGWMVNEIAPRVHNTGHCTLDSAETSQFENHLRACLGQKLGSTRSKPFFFMQNILGPAELGSDSTREIAPKNDSTGTSLYWYGKGSVGAKRKLGHWNATASTAEELQQKISTIEARYSAWAQTILREAGLS